MITGGCLCGAVRYEARAAPLTTRVCWCRLCQKLGAGSGTVNVGFASDSVTLTGALTDFVSTADSGTVLHRGFCPVCGTPVTSQAETRRHQIFLHAGTLDDPEVARPAMTIWTRAAPSWASIAPDIPRVEGQPQPVEMEALSTSDQNRGSILLRERLAAWHAANPLPPPMGLLADKAFFDELSGDL